MKVSTGHLVIGSLGISVKNKGARITITDNYVNAPFCFFA